MIDEQPQDQPQVESESEPTPTPPPPPREFEDLTLSEAFGLLLQRPGKTLAALFAIARSPSDQQLSNSAQPPSVFAPRQPIDVNVPYSLTTMQRIQGVLAEEQPLEDHPTQPPPYVIPPDLDVATIIPTNIRRLRLLLRTIATLIAFVGSYAMLNPSERTELSYISNGLGSFVIAIIVWTIAELLPFISRLVRRVFRDANNTNILPFRADDMVLVPLTTGRIAALIIAAVGSIYAFIASVNNQFTTEGVIAWFVAILAGVWAFAPQSWSPLVPLRRLRSIPSHFTVRLTFPLLALIAIMAVGTYFRLYDIPGTPPEMTSDHVEKLLDVQGIREGRTNIFFANNGGRDSLHFYFLAALSYLPGVEVNFNLLKVASAIEGLITIPVMYWMAKQLIGKRDRELAEIVGLLAASFVAVSAWHVFMSRLGLRIVLTPLFTALALGFLARGIRYNRRWDFLYAGLTLGFGLYGYQALRMLPVVVVLGVILALFIGAKTMRVRATLVGNLAALVVIAGIIFVPLYRFSVDYPELFWNRTSGRVFGDELTQTTDENGNLVRRTPTPQEQIEAFVGNLPNLMINWRNALLMYNWKGDVAWFHNSPNKAALDGISGGLLIVGVAAWLARAARRGDPVTWLLIPSILIMMLPSVLSLAFPIENPSHTRMSGTLPGIYLLIALPLGLILLELRRLVRRTGAILGTVLAVGLVGISFTANAQSYFTDYRASYISSSLPYSVGGEILRNFAVTNGSGYGNAFILAYPYWWDHRALGISGGSIHWNNTVLRLEDLPGIFHSAMTRSPSDPFYLDPNRELLFFLSIDDEAGRDWLVEHFPNGYLTTITTYMPRSFAIFTIPAPGYDTMNEILLEGGQEVVAPPAAS